MMATNLQQMFAATNLMPGNSGWIGLVLFWLWLVGSVGLVDWSRVFWAFERYLSRFSRVVR